MLWSSAPQPASSQDQGQDQEPNPLKRQRSDKEKLAAQKALRQELKGAYKTWLNQDVIYIITDEERKAFLSLGNDEERDAFIENFWLRRNPNPDSPENEFREEHYRRIQYANEHFAAGEPGWKTDRGRIYIMWGPPDSIDRHNGGGDYQYAPGTYSTPGSAYYTGKTIDLGGQMQTTATVPFEVWHYRSLDTVEGEKQNVDLEFVDTCQCGEYHFTIDPSEKNAFAHTPGGNGMSEIGTDPKHKTTGDPQNSGPDDKASLQTSKFFDRLQMAAILFAPPPIKFKDLDAFISEHKLLNGPVFPFEVRTDVVKVTDSMDMVPITLQIRIRDITFITKDGVAQGVVNILGKVTTITDRTVQTFEDTVQVEQPAELLGKTLDDDRVYWKALPLAPGLYRLDIAIKDVNNPSHVGIYGRALNVPAFHDEKLGTSSLILADKMNTVSSSEIGGGNFVIGNTYIRPRVSDSPAKPVSFKRDQQLNFWMQVYNLGINDATKSNDATVTYQIVKTGGADAHSASTDTVVFEKQLDSKDMSAHSDQLTVEKTLPMAGLEPGKYKVTIKVNDAISKQEIAQSAPFVVE